MRQILKAGALLTINAAVLVFLLGAVEFYFRIWGDEQRYYFFSNGVWQTFQPYVMVTSAVGEYASFKNQYTNESYPSTVRTNSLGFNDPHEFSLTRPYQKGPHEKLVLLTGGSAAWGIGASATDNTIAGRMQYHLNSLQNETKYTVINLGMVSWIAFQQFIALQLWGDLFDPDWIVVMDGFNDAMAGCQFSQGLGNPTYFASMRSYIHGYLLSTSRPVFYRGWLENELTKHSAAYRIITGKQYVPNDQIFDETSGEQITMLRQIIPTKVGQSREMLEFYLAAERATLKLFPKAKYILSTQPLVNQFTDDFADVYQFAYGTQERRAAIAKREKDLDDNLRQHENEPCGQKNGKPSFAYIYGNGAVQLERLAEKERAFGRHVEYFNLGTLFPDSHQERMPYFMDPVHLSDKGMDAIGKFYAEKVLAVNAAGAPGSMSIRHPLRNEFR